MAGWRRNTVTRYRPRSKTPPQGGARRVSETRSLELCSQGTQDKTVTAIEQQAAHHPADRVEIGVTVRTLGVSCHQAAASLVHLIFLAAPSEGNPMSLTDRVFGAFEAEFIYLLISHFLLIYSSLSKENFVGKYYF